MCWGTLFLKPVWMIAVVAVGVVAAASEPPPAEQTIVPLLMNQDSIKWPLILAQAEKAGKDTATGESKAARTTELTKEEGQSEHQFRDITDFFNVREANPRTTKGEWELEIPLVWQTKSNGKDDDVNIRAALEYGITDDLSVELGVLPINLGDGGDQGNGDLELAVFYRFIRETQTMPGFAAWAELRLPTGEASSGVDGELHFNLTKTICPKFRAHLEGFIETANGARGGEEEEDRRHFQWGVGPGFDYQINDKTVGVLNYVNRSSEEYGGHNNNILEVGVARWLVKGQILKAAVDIGLDGQEETPNFGVKVQWEIEW